MSKGNDLDSIGARVHWSITEHLGINQAEAARRLKVKPSQISRWINDPVRPPGEESLERIAQLTGVPQAWLRYGGDLPALGYAIQGGGIGADTVEEEGGEVPAPNYDGLGIELPGYERLHDRPRREFDRFMFDMIAAGLGREDLEEFGRGLLAPIAHLNTLHKGREESDARSEEDQMLIMDGMIPVLKKIVRERGRR